MSRRYFFGRAEAIRIDFFAFPRCGSHFLRACTAGLFDLVALPHADSASEEAAARNDELDPLALYALNLREDGVAHQPVWFNATANGRHGHPIHSGFPVLILIRDPRAAVYSLYRVSRDRWNMPIADARSWARAQFAKFAEFYARAGEALDAEPGRSLLLRYEDLRRSAEAIENLAAFVGAPPKLSPKFVYHLTRFETIVREGPRTFYRAADAEAWRRDEQWAAAVDGLAVPDISRFGYGAV